MTGESLFILQLPVSGHKIAAGRGAHGTQFVSGMDTVAVIDGIVTLGAANVVLDKIFTELAGSRFFGSCH